VALVLMLLGIGARVHGYGRAVFGPEELTIGRLHLHLSRHGFGVEDPGDAILGVTKSTPGKEIQRGFVLFNRGFIPLRGFFGGDELVFRTPVRLQSDNHLLVVLLGRPGGSVTIEVSGQEGPISPPEVLFRAEPETIIRGGSATLTWSTEEAQSCTIDQGVGSVELSGSRVVAPEETTTYTITATGPGGRATGTATVTVLYPPAVTISASPEAILYGESATLSWSSRGAEGCLIEPGLGPVGPSGRATVSPRRTTTYTITATGPGGTARDQASIFVAADVEPQPEGSFGKQYQDLIPPDATVGSYEPRRFSLITGLVRDSGGVPIEAVSVGILDHSEYGTALTDTRGRFSIPVEGGGVLTVIYQREGYLTLHRRVYVPCSEIAVSETVVMIGEDPVSTEISLDGNPDTVYIHESSEVTDEFGRRSCSLVFTGDNRAYETDTEGQVLGELTTITVRATEYPTPESMPARLPPSSAFTYCVELCVDGAERVRFEEPIVTWVDNFLGFDVGFRVPVGFYDRGRGVWVPGDDGVVVRLLDTDRDGIVDALDSDGDRKPDDLDRDGSFGDEVTGLGDQERYPPGSTFWRLEVSNFSPWDFNCPYGPVAGATLPNPRIEPRADGKLPDLKDCRTQSASYIEDRGRILHEEVPIPGTDLTLHYGSNRVGGYKEVITVAASGDTVPSVLKGIIVRVEVAGRAYEQSLEPFPNQVAQILWDGLDYLGRPVVGMTRARTGVGFVYDAVYYRSQQAFDRSFGQAGTDATSIATRQEIVLWRRGEVEIFRTGARGTIADGWTISCHHRLRPSDPSTLYKGDGGRIRKRAGIIETVAGTGSFVDPLGDGGPATEAALHNPEDLALDAGGNLYILDSGTRRIRKVKGDGTIWTLARLPDRSRTHGLAIDRQGNVYVTDAYYHRVWKIDPMGRRTPFAGTGTGGYSGDNGPATEARLNAPWDVAADPFGNLYIAELGNQTVRKVDPSGIITTVAGTGSYGYNGDGIPATRAKLHYPCSLAVDSAGNLYIADWKNHRVRKVDPSGIITTVAGTGGYGSTSDGVPATEAQLWDVFGIAVDSSGILYVSHSSTYRARRVDGAGIITTVAGNRGFGYGGEGVPATGSPLEGVYGLALDTRGGLYIAEYWGHRVRRVSTPGIFLSAMEPGDFAFCEEGGLGHILSSSGRHKRTIDLDTGALLYEFGYNEENQLISITDRFGNKTMIERDAGGPPTSII